MGRQRRASYEAEMAAAGLAPRYVEGDWTEGTGRRVAKDLLRSPDRPTAIFAANDLSGVGVLAAADDLGLRVPRTSRSWATTTPGSHDCTACR